ncbi:MAG: GatB/YqeY domain-containing protein [Coxiellaceae bacterium]|jgi:uncharacterized protein YqeY|nr:GatB/YqeY domain-containing protein [Coxiellaceae bacterium]
MSALLLQIQEDVKNAMRTKAKEVLETLRLLLANIKQREIDERITLNDSQIIAVIDKMIRQRHDSIEQYQKGSRQDLADKEAAEIEVLKKYMPQTLTETEIKNLITEAIFVTGANSIKDMGKVMAYIKTKAQSRADIGKISTEVKNTLTN